MFCKIFLFNIAQLTVCPPCTYLILFQSITFMPQYLNKGHKAGTEPCDCPDPTKPTAKTGSLAGQWKRHHDDMVAVAKRLDPNLDVVFLGDSIIERFGGTAGMGAQVVSGHKAAFDRRFSRNAGGRMEGKAFGTEQDTVSNPFGQSVETLF